MGRSVYVAQKRSSSELQVWFLFVFHRFYCQPCKPIGKFTSGSSCVANSLKRFTSTSSRIFSTVNGKIE